MNFFQFNVLFYCILLSFSCSNSKDARKVRSTNKRSYKKAKLNKQSEDKTIKPTTTKDSIKDSIKDSANLVIDQVESASNDSLLNCIDSLYATNVELKDKLEDCSQRQFGVPIHLDLMWSKFLESFEVDGNQAKKVVFNNKSFDTYLVNITTSDIRFYWQDDKILPIRSLNKLAEVIEKEGTKKLVFGTNAGMYTPSKAPQGLFIQDGEVLKKIDRRKNEFGNFYMQPNGVFLIDTHNIAQVMPTTKYQDELNASVKFATQSGPMVVIDGEVNEIFKKDSKHLNIRSGVGVIDSAHVVFVISNKRVSFYDFAHVFKENFNCSSALYLDGAISEMYLPELRRVQNGGNFGPMIGVTNKQ